MHKLKVKGWEEIYHTNANQKKAGVVILILDKVDSRIRKIAMDKEGYYTMFKGSIHQETIVILTNWAEKYMN